MGLTDKLLGGRVGFSIREVMDGRHQFEHGCGSPGRLPMELCVTRSAQDLAKHLDPFNEDFLHYELEGTVTVGGLCTGQPCFGSMEIKYFSEHAISYTCDFEVAGTGYTFVGRKVNIWPWNLPVSHTTCFGTIKESDNGKLISTAELFSRWWRCPSFVSSLRLL